MKFVIIIAIAFVLFSSIFVINSAFAQSYTGVLKLDSIPSNVKAGGIITFSGTLTTTDGRVVQDATIYIKDDVDFDIDTVLGTVTTDESGKFSADWKAVTRSSGSYDFYAVYEGGGNISSSRSVTQTVNVL
ncbi:MAG: Ig-like domain-containing protein, partial [Nitrosopumilus sp.]